MWEFVLRLCGEMQCNGRQVLLVNVKGENGRCVDNGSGRGW